MFHKKDLRKWDGRKLYILRDAKKFLLLLFLVFLVFRFIIGVSLVSGNSMLPTYTNRQPVIYSRLNKNFNRGDVVSIRVPSGDYYIKRIIAVEGDTISIKDGGVFINGTLIDEPYIQGKTFLSQGHVEYPYTLEDNQVFVMGDNREASIDSRSFGAINTRQIKGKILFK